MKTLRQIMLVEDSLNDVELTLAALDEHHVANKIVVARDGAEALDYLYSRGVFADREGGMPAVILLDIKMPRVSGLDVLRQMKGDPLLKNIPVVMLTSSREEPDLATSYALGVNAYVVKPVDFQQFIDAVKLVGAFWAIVNEPPPQAA